MSWLDNPVANMYGPRFLLLYLAVVVVTLGGLRYLLRHWDSTAGEPAPPVPPEPDPYAVAYLRGGLGEVARVAVVELLQRGYLTDESGVYATAPEAPDRRHLEGVPGVVYGWFEAKGSSYAREAFAPSGLESELRKSVEPRLREPLEKERLLATEETWRSRKRLAALALAVVVGLGGYKLAVALTKGHTNFGFLVLLLIGSLVAVAVIYYRTPSWTARGKKYLDALSVAFRPLTSTARESSAPLMVGLFGVAALAGTSFAFVADELRQLRWISQSSGDYAGSCGSSCGGDCGGGCGGGCGGCGD